MSKFTRVKHTIRWSIILTLSLYFGIIAFLNIPFIQKQVSVYTEEQLTQLFQTKVRIGNVDLGMLNRIIVRDLELYDQAGNELLKIARFSAKADITALFHGRIRISSVQLFGLDAHLRKEVPQGPTNFQFILDAFAPKDSTKKKSEIDLRINSILIRRGKLAYDVASEPETPQRFNPAHLNFSNISATLSLKALQPDSVNAQIRRMSFNEQSGFQLKRLSAKLTANDKRVQLEGLHVGLPATDIDMDSLVIAAESFTNLSTLDEVAKYATSLHASITPADLAPFVPALQFFKDPLLLRFTAQGKGARAECSEFSLTDNYGQIKVHAKGIVNAEGSVERPYFYGKIAQAEVTPQGMIRLFQNLTGQTEPPAILERIGFIRFKGDLSGYPHQLTTHGNLHSNVGSLQANVTMHTDTTTHNRSFSGRVASEALQLGKLLNKEKNWGNAAFDIELKGFKYRNSKPESYIKGTVSELQYNQYAYHNITLDGHYRPGGFKGKIAMDDPNGSIVINGQFITAQPMPDFNLHASIRNFRPHDLRLTPKHKDTSIALNLTADFSGHSIDDMEGRIDLDSLTVLAAEQEKSYFLQNLNITAGHNPEGKKEIQIQSPFLQGEVKGNYSYQTVFASLQRILSQHLPSAIPSPKSKQMLNNDFTFNLKVENAAIASKVFSVPLELHMPANLQGYVNDSLKQMSINGYFPRFTYKGKVYESGVLACENTNQELQCQLRANTLLQKGAMFNFSLLARAKSDSLRTTLFWGNNTNVTYSGKVDAISHFSRSDEKQPLHTQIDIQPSTIILNDTTWHVHPSTVTVDKDSIEIKNFLFEHAEQHLKINGLIGKRPSDSCMVDLRNINLLYIMDMIQFHAVKFQGLASGKISLQHVMDDPLMQADLKVNRFSLNDALLGEAKIKGNWDKEIGGIRLLADIQETDSLYTRVNGFISPKMKELDLNIEAGGTNMAFLQPFIDGIFSDISGRAFGNIRLFGPFSQLDLEGVARAKVGMKVNVLNTRFEASADSVRITPGNFRFENVRLTDPEGHTGWANGTLSHTKLKNLAYQFRFDTDHMLVYNTQHATPDFPFYGQIYTTGNVRLRGEDNALNVDGTLRAESQTSFVYMLASVAAATSNQFITFVDRTPKRLQEHIETEVYHYLNQPKKGEEADIPIDIRINLQIEPTEQANMKIIMDPIAGDYISAKGNGNLRINFFNKGEFQIFGDYNITEGIYKMSMQNVIRKDFVLQPGGTVTFNGNPKAANLNVQAVYTVNSASLNDLLADASSSKGNVRVNCLLNLTGDLTSPNLSFDLELPTVNEEDRELVRSLTSTEEQMNTQIIYLLGVGKFYTYDYANNTTQSDATSSLAFSTLSGQLNNMLSQVLDNQNWNIGTNLSTGEKGWSDVEAEAILSGRLLNNRLIINGNFGYKENTMRNTNFVGDFEAIWLLTKNGEFRLRGYNQTNDRYFTKSTLTTQGIGLMYKKDFTNWKELVDWFLHRRKLRTSNPKRKEEKKQVKEKATLPAIQEKRQRINQ